MPVVCEMGLVAAISGRSLVSRMIAFASFAIFVT
jgi:hypothetical protein